jgi:hypothetical protein
MRDDASYIDLEYFLPDAPFERTRFAAMINKAERQLNHESAPLFPAKTFCVRERKVARQWSFLHRVPVAPTANSQ